MKPANLFISVLILSIILSSAVCAQDSSLIKELNSLKKYNENLRHRLDEIERMVDDLIWYK